ncbi:MAG: hypothetical protein ACI936_001252 [Paraglaciecola sp.]
MESAREGAALTIKNYGNDKLENGIKMILFSERIGKFR